MYVQTVVFLLINFCMGGGAMRQELGVAQQHIRENGWSQPVYQTSRIKPEASANQIQATNGYSVNPSVSCTVCVKRINVE